MVTRAKGNAIRTGGGDTPRSARRRNLVLPREGRRYNPSEARSRTVHLMRFLLPATALTLILIVGIWSQWQNIENGFKIGYSMINPDEARTLRMVKPRISGMNGESKPYLVTADEAVRDSPSADRIRLSNIKGDITTESGAWVMLMAPKGIYHESNETLDLSGGVDVFHDKGLRFASPSARVNLKDGSAEGHETATANGPSIDITGEGFKIVDDGKKVIFTGKSKAILYPSDSREQKPPARGDGR